MMAKRKSVARRMRRLPKQKGQPFAELHYANRYNGQHMLARSFPSKEHIVAHLIDLDLGFLKHEYRYGPGLVAYKYSWGYRRNGKKVIEGTFKIVDKPEQNSR